MVIENIKIIGLGLAGLALVFAGIKLRQNGYDDGFSKAQSECQALVDKAKQRQTDNQSNVDNSASKLADVIAKNNSSMVNRIEEIRREAATKPVVPCLNAVGVRKILEADPSSAPGKSTSTSTNSL